MRRFEFSDSTSNKFWEVEVKGKTLNINFGKIGTKGQSKPKDFATPEKAKAEMEKLIKEKTGKGYVEVGGKAVKAVKAAGNLAAAKSSPAKPAAGKKTKAGNMGEGLSKAEKKAKAEKVLAMFAGGQWELARGILEAANDEPWLFEELLKGCKIEDGKIKHSIIFKKYFKSTYSYKRFHDYGNADMVILGVLLESPSKIKKLLKLETNQVKSVQCNPGQESLGYFAHIHEEFSKIHDWHIEPEDDLYEIKNLSDSAAKLLSNWDMESVGFDKLANLSDKAINYLCTACPEYLDLPALKSLSGAAAKSFVNLLERGAIRISLDGLESISDEAVKFLSKGYYYWEEDVFDIFDDGGDGLDIPKKLQKLVEEFKEKQPKKK
jgi:predicted DNA-binding WGR domain protein